MNKYIDADTVIRKYIDTDINKFSNPEVKIVLENLKQNILKAPSIDLVRCGECIRWENGRVDFSNCELMGIVKPDGFCSEGKRRESEYSCKRCKHQKVPKADYPCEYCYKGDRYEPQMKGIANDSRRTDQKTE